MSSVYVDPLEGPGWGLRETHAGPSGVPCSNEIDPITHDSFSTGDEVAVEQWGANASDNRCFDRSALSTWLRLGGNNPVDRTPINGDDRALIVKDDVTHVPENEDDDDIRRAEIRRAEIDGSSLDAWGTENQYRMFAYASDHPHYEASVFFNVVGPRPQVPLLYIVGPRIGRYPDPERMRRAFEGGQVEVSELEWDDNPIHFAPLGQTRIDYSRQRMPRQISIGIAQRGADNNIARVDLFFLRKESRHPMAPYILTYGGHA